MSLAGSPHPFSECLRLMILALETLDGEKAPPNIGAHLHLAIQHLRKAMSSLGTNGLLPS